MNIPDINFLSELSDFRPCPYCHDSQWQLDELTSCGDADNRWTARARCLNCFASLDVTSQKNHAQNTHVLKTNQA